MGGRIHIWGMLKKKNILVYFSRLFKLKKKGTIYKGSKIEKRRRLTPLVLDNDPLLPQITTVAEKLIVCGIRKLLQQ